MARKRKISESLNNVGAESWVEDFSGFEEDAINAEEEDTFKTVTQWSSVDGRIVPVSGTIPRLEAGYYSIGFSQSLGMYFSKEKIELNKLYRLPNKATDLIMNDISKFWTLEDTYKKYHRVFRRNYLLYSAPGTGETSLINLMCEDLIKTYDGLVFSLNTEPEIENFPDTAVNYFIIPDDTQLRKLNLNRLSLNELKRHPYISFYQARAIVDYRRLHGPLESLQQLSLSRDFPPEAIRRLAPYVEF